MPVVASTIARIEARLTHFAAALYFGDSGFTLLDVVQFVAAFVVKTSLPSAVLGIKLEPTSQGPPVETAICCLQATTRTKVKPK